MTKIYKLKIKEEEEEIKTCFKMLLQKEWNLIEMQKIEYTMINQLTRLTKW